MANHRNSRITDPMPNENTNFSGNSLQNYSNIPTEDNVYPVKSPPTELQLHYVPHIVKQISYDEDEFYTNNIEEANNIEEEKKNFQDEIQSYEEINPPYDYDELQEKFKDLVNKNDELKNEIEEIKKQRLKNAQTSEENQINDVSKQRLNKNKSKSPEQKMIDKLQRSLELKEIQIQSLKNEKTELDVKNDDLYQKTTNLEDELKELHKKNALLENEASKYQSALGVATNFQLKDDDQNHGVKLNNDISNLNDDVKTYVTNLKGEITVSIPEIKKLLVIYKCPAEIMNQKEKNNRLLIQAVLHRHVIETIMSYALQYFEGQDNLEAAIVKNESLLSELLIQTSESRVGNDEITRVGPTKLRQQIYSILSNRGFSDVINDNDKNKDNKTQHPFIQCHKEQLNKEMNRLRNIKDNEKRSFVENLAADLIRNVVKIFWFRLKVQEPVANFDWIPSNTKVDQVIMEANQTNDDDDVLYVDLCYFPLIGRNLNTNNQKIYTLAKVITRKTPYQIQERTPQHQTQVRKNSKQKNNSEELPNKQKTNSGQESTKQKEKSWFSKKMIPFF